MSEKKRILSERELSLFCTELAMLLSAGLLLEDGVLSLQEEAGNAEEKALFAGIYSVLEEGQGFAVALEEVGCFPDYLVHMVGLGEKTGNIETVLQSLGTYYNEKEQLSHSIKTSLIYPVIMLVLMTLVLLVLSFEVFPLFAQVYIDLGSDIPTVAALMMLAGKVAAVVLLIALLAMGAALLGVYLHQRKKIGDGKEGLVRLFLEKSRIGGLLASARFASVLSMAVTSGMELPYAMELSEKLVQSSKVQQKIVRCRTLLEEGEAFSTALLRAELFVGMGAALLRVGIKSGRLDQALTLVAKRYAEDAERKTTDTVSRIEPTIVIVMAVLVGMILLGVMLPLLGVLSAMG